MPIQVGEVPQVGPPAFLARLATLQPRSVVLVVAYTFATMVRHLLRPLQEDQTIAKVIDVQANSVNVAGHRLHFAPFAIEYAEMSLRGLSVDLLYLDEPERCPQEFIAALATRIKPGGAVVLSHRADVGPLGRYTNQSPQETESPAS